MATSTSSAPELTAEAVQRILVQPLEEASTFLASGPRIFDSASQVRIPTLVAGTAPAWYGEGEQITDDDADFGEIVLLPSTLKSVKILTRFSNELARQSVISLDPALRDRLVGDVARTLDTQFWSASGDGITTPRGLFAYAGTQSLPVDAALSIDDLHDAEGMVLAANVDPSRVSWVMTSREFIELRKIKDLQDRYLLQPDPTKAGGYPLLGHPVTSPTGSPTPPAPRTPRTPRWSTSARSPSPGTRRPASRS